MAERTLLVTLPAATLDNAVPNATLDGSVPDAGLQISTSGFVPGPTPPEDDEAIMWIDFDELFENADSGTQRKLVFDPLANAEAHVFRGGGTQDRTYFIRDIPDAWQGRTVQLYGKFSHLTAGLTGTGTPPDDEVQLDLGWFIGAAGVALPNLGTINDGTAPNEASVLFQLGVTQKAPLWQLIQNFAFGALDRTLYIRINCNGPAQGFAGFTYNQGFALVPVPLP